MTLFWDENNWQGLCSAPCHSYKTATEDGGFGARRSMVTFVCGAPGSGKSTYVREHWRPGDLIWDFDAVVQAITGLSSHEQLDKTTMAFMLAMRDGFYLKAQREQDKRIWIIESCPTRQERMDRKQRFNAKVVLLNTDIETCRQRIAARGDSWSLERLQWWFDRYESD